MSCWDEPYSDFDKHEVRLMADNRDIRGLINVFRVKDRYSGEMRYDVSKKLAEIGGDDVVDALIEAVSEGNQDLMTGAVDTLGLIGGRRAADGLLSAIRDDRVRVYARMGLIKIGGPYVIERLVADLKDDDPVIRESSAYTLGHIKDATVVEPLIGALSDSEAGVRSRAAVALGELRDRRAVMPLIGLLQDGVMGVKYDVVKALGNLRDKRAADVLLDLFKDDNSEVIIEALSYVGDARAVGPMADLMLKERNRAQVIAYALRHIEDGKGIIRLLEMLEDQDDSVRSIAAFALGCACHHMVWQGQNDRVIEALTRAFLNDNARVRSKAIFALGEIEDERAVDLFITAFYDVDERVRKSAVQACAFFPDRDERIYRAIWKAAKDPRVGQSLRDEMHRIDSL